MKETILLESTLSADAFWMVNKKMARHVGMSAAVLLADLISKRKYFRDRGELDDQGGFFNVSGNLESDLVSNEKAIRKQKVGLVESGFLVIKKRGVPAKHYFYLQDKAIVDFLGSSSPAQSGTTGATQKANTRPSQKGTAINKNKEEEPTTKINDTHAQIPDCITQAVKAYNAKFGKMLTTGTISGYAHAASRTLNCSIEEVAGAMNHYTAANFSNNFRHNLLNMVKKPDAVGEWMGKTDTALTGADVRAAREAQKVSK